MQQYKVSVWTGKLDSEKLFKKYIEVTYSDDGDMESPFMADFGIEYYDSQFQEALFDASENKAEIFKDFSYKKNFVAKIPVQNLFGSNCFILLYNFNYDGSKEKAGNFKYAGTFNYR